MEQYEHIILPEQVRTAIEFSPRTSGGGKPQIPKRDRAEHAARLERLFEDARTRNEKIQKDMLAVSLPARTGTYLEFAGAPASELLTKSLEDQKSGIRLLNIRTKLTAKNEEQTFATVYVPHGEESKFISKLNQYANEDTQFGKPKNDNLFRSIESVNIALLQSLWTDSINEFPTEKTDWYEIWIRTNESDTIEEQHKSFIDTLNALHIQYKEDSILTFPERSVFLVYANIEALSLLSQSSDQMAEIRGAQILTGFLFKECRSEQQEWVEDLQNRVNFSPNEKSVVCVLDTGVNNGHPLLSEIIKDEHCGSVVGEGSADRAGHGTCMCGTTIYGDLRNCIANNNPVIIDNHIASIKLFPYKSLNRKDAWGYLTKQAVAVSDVMFPRKNICYCMAITAEDCEKGKPSSWSGSIDSITYNEGNDGKLFMISAGNIRHINDQDKDIIEQYPYGNGLRPVQDPAQSWNSVTVGAYTTLTANNSHELRDKERIAPSGGISPFSRTSLLWEKSSLIKPEVMFEGGNLIKTNDKDFPYSDVEELQLLTTSSTFSIKGFFDVINATSAATALASKFAGKLQSKYPELWAESIRGLMVHTAKWTQCMEEQFPVSNRKEMERRLRFCGYGVPSEERALYSYGNGLTYIAQEIIQPFIKERKGNVKINEMHFFEFPWPKEILEQLGEIEVSMRITLSYFIEPAPGEIGWKDKYRYASCGLRFDVNNENEDSRAFQLRINKAIEAEENEERGKNDSSRWTIGADNRNKGSIHSDELKLTAAQLSTCNLIAVYPIGGWWKTRTNLKKYNKKIRYSLIVSLDTPTENIDMYVDVQTKIAAIVQTPVEVKVPIN